MSRGCPSTLVLHQNTANHAELWCFLLSVPFMRGDAAFTRRNFACSFEQWSISNFSKAFFFLGKKKAVLVSFSHRFSTVGAANDAAVTCSDTDHAFA